MSRCVARHARGVGLFGALLLAVTAAVTAVPVPARAASGSLAVASPLVSAQLPNGPVSITGSAVGGSVVRLVVADASTHATVLRASRPASAAGQWSYTWSAPPPGGYLLKATGSTSTGTTTSVQVPFDVADPSGPAYLSLLIGRSIDTLAPRCQPLPGAVPITQIAAALHDLGLSAGGPVVTDWASEDGSLTCNGDALYPSWQQLADLRDGSGWSFVSEGRTHTPVANLTADQQYQEACGSAAELAGHGHSGAWAMFAYPGGPTSTAMQTAVTARCYAFGRTYAYARNHLAQLGQAPYWQDTVSVNGGACTTPGLPCSGVGKKRYVPVDQLSRLMDAGPGEWSVIQVYKLVTGAHGSTTSTGPSWDCTSGDWREHWSNRTEVYCWNDYLAALQTIPATVTVTDPATVGRAVFGTPAAPVSSIDSGPAASTTSTDAAFTLSSSDPRSYFTCSLDGAPAALCDSGATYAGLASGDHNLQVIATDAFGQPGPPATWQWTVATGG